MNINAVLRAGAVTGLATAFVLAGAGVASAHVTVNSPGATQGGFGVLTFRVPTESNTASTSGLRVLLPADQPLAFVSVQPKAGWTYTVKRVELATPIESDDGAVTEAVSEIDWTSTTGAIKPGEFDEFRLSVGPLPKADQMVFKAIQHYSDGNDVSWIEQSAAGGAEPEFPAPTLQLAASGAAGGATPSASAVTVQVGAAATKVDSASNGAVITALIVGGLGVMLGGVGLAFAASRHRGGRASAAPVSAEHPTVGV